MDKENVFVAIRGFFIAMFRSDELKKVTQAAVTVRVAEIYHL